MPSACSSSSSKACSRTTRRRRCRCPSMPRASRAAASRPRTRARSVSIDTPLDEDDDRSMGDVLPDHSEDPEDATLRFERDTAVWDVLEGICQEIGDPRLRTIIEKRLLADEPETLAVLG